MLTHLLISDCEELVLDGAFRREIETVGRARADSASHVLVVDSLAVEDLLSVDSFVLVAGRTGVADPGAGASLEEAPKCGVDDRVGQVGPS